MKRFSCVLSVLLVLMAMIVAPYPRVNAQENTDPAAALAENPEKNSLSEKWDRLIYVPFRELQKVFDNQDASVVLPYAEYLDLMKRAIQAVPATTGNQDAVIGHERIAARGAVHGKAAWMRPAGCLMRPAGRRLDGSGGTPA